MNEVTIDQAIQNLDKILAHILIEQDLKLKGIQIGHGWQQLAVIKQIVSKMGFLDRRQLNKNLKEKETRLIQYEDNFLSEMEMKLAIEDVQKVNDLLNNYKSQIIYEKRKEIEEKLFFLNQELERIYLKNINRMEQNWKDILKQIQEIIQLIKNVLNSQNEHQFTSQRQNMNQMLKTMYVSKRIKDEEEEDLLKIAIQMEQMKKVQAEYDQQINQQGSNLDIAESGHNNLQQNQQQNQQNYNRAYELVQQRRRTKIKLFFQGLFTALGAFGGKIGAAFGLAIGTITGKKVSQAITKSSIN